MKKDFGNENQINENIVFCQNRGKNSKHEWKAADNMRFVDGSSADVFCAYCDMGAITDENGSIIISSIAKVFWVSVQ